MTPVPATPIALKVLIADQAPLIASRIRLYLPSSARMLSWYRIVVSMCESVSSSRLTLLPFRRVGSSELCTLGVTVAGDWP